MYVSILLHVAALFLKCDELQIFEPTKELVAEKQQERRVRFELVETPNIESEENPEETDLVSDKSLRARDTKEEKGDSNEPFSEGITEFKTMPSVPPSEAVPITQLRDNAEEETEKEKVEDQNEGNEDFPDYSGDILRDTAILEKLKLPKKESDPNKEPQPNRESVIPEPSHRSRRPAATEFKSDFSFSTYAWDFAPYMLELKRRISNNLYPPEAFWKYGFTQGKVIVRFKIARDGKLLGLEVLDRTGHVSLKESSVNAIRASAKFPPLPSSFPDKVLEVTGGFYYIIIYR